MKRSTLISFAVIGAVGASLVLFRSFAAVRILREAALSAARPILLLGERGAGLLGRGGSGGRDNVGPGDEERIAALLFERESLREENDRLRAALALAHRTGLALKGADVIRYGRDPGGEFLIIGAGENQGLATGNVIVDERGAAIGAVAEIGPNSARIAVASNAGQAHDVLLLPGGVQALGRGLGARAFALELIPLETPVRVGDYVVLRGYGLAQTLLLARISAVNRGVNSAFQDARAVLVADPSGLRTVFIVAENQNRQ